jgi:hypothetical protein
MRIRLLKSWTHHGKRYPVGTIITYTKAQELIDKNEAEKYTGSYPPKKKMKLNLKDLIKWQ